MITLTNTTKRDFPFYITKSDGKKAVRVTVKAGKSDQVSPGNMMALERNAHFMALKASGKIVVSGDKAKKTEKKAEKKAD